MKRNVKFYTYLLALIVILSLIISIPVIIIRESSKNIDIFETNDLNNYGKIVGNYDNETPTQFINSFFPDKIESTFSDVSYHYKAKKFDTYAYECYVEFVIDDTELFFDYLNKHINPKVSTPFAFDESYHIYTISNQLYLHTPTSQDSTYAIGWAEIGNILYSVSEQRIIFVALGVYDGGGTYTSDLNYFFSRFNIDAWTYQTIYGVN